MIISDLREVRIGILGRRGLGEPSVSIFPRRLGYYVGDHWFVNR